MVASLKSFAVTAAAALVGVSAATSVTGTVLIIARSDADVAGISPGLDGYGIPWEKALIPKAGAALPTLNSSSADGNYVGIITSGGLSYDYSGNFKSALTAAQWNQLYGYQSAFHVRLVRLDEFPGSEFGSTTYDANGNGCCDNGVNAGMSLVSTDSIPAAGIKANAPVNMDGLYHYQAKITNTTTTTAWAMFEPAGNVKVKTVGAVVNKLGNREQMVWFTSFASDWSLASSFLQHSYIHWMTRSLFVGKRKIHLSPQVDDLQLATTMYDNPQNEFKIATGDLDAHVTWQKALNGRLPAASNLRLEFGHNGNGNIEAACDKNNADKYCKPSNAVEYPDQTDTENEYKKPLGTGTDIWPKGYEKYNWTDACSRLDSFANWFRTADNLNAFGHISHTFTHEALNNATYHDANREIQFNQAWMAQMGIDKATYFTADGIIPPAITGLHNGDVIRAWLDNGIKYVVGDNTRPVLRNPNSKYWPLATNMQDNGAAGLWIIPRFATEMNYNCASSQCVTKQYKDFGGKATNFQGILDIARATNVNYLMNMQADPYMFHQANLRTIDHPTITVGSQTGKFSLLQSWVETVTQEIMRLTTWPMVSQTHDEFAHYFLDRITLDQCKPSAKMVYSDDGKSIAAVTVTANGNTCAVPIPVTLPSGTASDAKIDKVAQEPPIAWVTLSGQPVTIQLSSPIAL